VTFKNYPGEKPVFDDKDGLARPTGSGVDIGAYEKK
jgi:hypothetical protein